MREPTQQASEETEELPLSKAAEYLLDECRMVIPGLQALFGFQLIVVFSPGFTGELGAPERYVHLVAITLSALAVAIIMTPAALHRQRGSREVTGTFIRVSSRLLLLGMFALAMSICLDFYLIAVVIADDLPVAVLSAVLFAFFVMSWFVFPRMRALQKLVGG
jgi:hypothetical protein